MDPCDVERDDCGNITIEDDRGNRYRGRVNSYGDIDVKDNHGNSYTGKVDRDNNVTLYEEESKSYSSSDEDGMLVIEAIVLFWISVVSLVGMGVLYVGFKSELSIPFGSIFYSDINTVLDLSYLICEIGVAVGIIVGLINLSYNLAEEGSPKRKSVKLIRRFYISQMIGVLVPFTASLVATIYLMSEASGGAILHESYLTLIGTIATGIIFIVLAYYYKEWKH